jgi:hypothetical protein
VTALEQSESTCEESSKVETKRKVQLPSCARLKAWLVTETDESTTSELCAEQVASLKYRILSDTTLPEPGAVQLA